MDVLVDLSFRQAARPRPCRSRAHPRGHLPLRRQAGLVPIMPSTSCTSTCIPEHPVVKLNRHPTPYIQVHTRVACLFKLDLWRYGQVCVNQDQSENPEEKSQTHSKLGRVG
jgi:hypothetical protein